MWPDWFQARQYLWNDGLALVLRVETGVILGCVTSESEITGLGVTKDQVTLLTQKGRAQVFSSCFEFLSVIGDLSSQAPENLLPLSQTGKVGLMMKQLALLTKWDFFREIDKLHWRKLELHRRLLLGSETMHSFR